MPGVAVVSEATCIGITQLYIYLKRIEQAKEPCKDCGILANSQQPEDPGQSQ